jgi:tRNA(fMet)-specific endonuclease VapC
MPVNGRYALDTNIVIALIDGDVSVRDRILSADEIFIPAPVIGELYFGAFNSARPDCNAARIDDLVNWYAILPIDELTAKAYGGIRRELRVIGKPIPENDIWTAAIAQQRSVTLATRDSHFEVIEKLSVDKW